MEIHTPISGVGFNPLTPASEAVIYTSTPGLQHIAVNLFKRLRWNFFSVGPVEKQVFLHSELPRRGEVPLSDLMAVLSAPHRLQSKPPAGRLPAGARLLMQGRKPPTLKFSFPQNDCADVVQTSA